MSDTTEVIQTTRKIFQEIYKRGLSSKWDVLGVDIVKYVHQCPCCSYVCELHNIKDIRLKLTMGAPIKVK